MAASKGSGSAGKTGTKKSAGKPHPGFQAAAAGIARKQGVSMDRARAILAASTRRASPAAKRANPNLKKVTKKKGG